MNKLLHTKHFWAYAIILIGLILLVGEVINDRFTMHDLEVYYRTAARMLQGEEIYRIAADKHYVYKYSPTAGLYFIPFTVLPFVAAKVIYWLLLMLLTLVVLQLLYSMATGIAPAPTTRRGNIVLFLSFLAVGAHVHREWHLGQVNFVLLALYVTMLLLWLQGKYGAAGLVLAASVFIKPFGLIFIPYLVLRQKFGMLAYAIVGAVLLGLLPFLLYPSVDAFTHLYQSWFQELLIEMSAKQSLLQDGNHTIFSVLARYTPIRFVVESATAARVYQLALLAAIGSFVLWFIYLGKRLDNRVVADIALLTMFIPLFAFTSQNAFLFALPCILLLLYSFPILPTTAKVLTVCGCILIGANIRDLMGSSLYGVFENASVYTFGTLALLAALTMLRYQHSRRHQVQQHAAVAHSFSGATQNLNSGKHKIQ